MFAILSEFGNSAVLLLLSLLIGLWLAWAVGRRAALAWALALLACTATIAVLKIYFGGCPLLPFGLRSPSGHAGFSLFVYGGITLGVMHDDSGWRRRVLPWVGTAWIAAIAWSRHVLGAHTPTEIVFGLLVGGAALLLFVRLRGPVPVRHFPFVRVVVLAAILAGLFYSGGWRPTPESWLQALGVRYAYLLPFCGTAG